MLPDMYDALIEWERQVTIKTVTRQTVDFVEQDIISGRTQNCVVQVAQKEKLNPEQIDWSLEYIMVHSGQGIGIGEFVEFEGKDYKVIDRGFWSGYGYTEVTGEETKRPLLVPTV